jgi:hypothetical protein
MEEGTKYWLEGEFCGDAGRLAKKIWRSNLSMTIGYQKWEEKQGGAEQGWLAVVGKAEGSGMDSMKRGG